MDFKKRCHFIYHKIKSCGRGRVNFIWRLHLISLLLSATAVMADSKHKKTASDLVFSYDYIGPDNMLNYDTINELRYLANKVKYSVEEDNNPFTAPNSVSLSYGRKCDLFNEKLKGFIARYINLFLYKLDLKNIDLTQVESENIKVDLQFSVSSKDLVYLQNISKHLKRMENLDDLEIIDSIFVKGLQVKENLMYESIFMYLINFIVYICYSKHFYFFLFFIGTAFIISYIIWHKLYVKPLIFLTIFLNYCIITEGLKNYYNELQRTEECRYGAENMSFFEKVKNYFLGNECLTRVENVSLLSIMLHTYGKFILEIPCKIFGSSIREFTKSINDYYLFMGPFTYIVILIMSLVFAISVVFCFTSRRIRFWILGMGMEIGNDQVERKEMLQEAIPKNRSTIQNIFIQTLSVSLPGLSKAVTHIEGAPINEFNLRQKGIKDCSQSLEEIPSITGEEAPSSETKNDGTEMENNEEEENLSEENLKSEAAAS